MPNTTLSEPLVGLADADHVMLAGAEVIDRLAGELLAIDPVVEVDVAGTLRLIEVPFGIPEIHLHGRFPSGFSVRFADFTSSPRRPATAYALLDRLGRGFPLCRTTARWISISRRCSGPSADERPRRYDDGVGQPFRQHAVELAARPRPRASSRPRPAAARRAARSARARTRRAAARRPPARSPIPPPRRAGRRDALSPTAAIASRTTASGTSSAGIG